jgi:hypothetical protein
MKNVLRRSDPKKKIEYSLQEVASSLVIAMVESGVKL